jgi:hypothetical protein
MKNPGGHEYNIIPVRPSLIKYADYQRGGIERHIEKIDAQYDGDVQNEPKLSYRDGIYWCFDGQQTITAWMRKFNDEPIMCKVYLGLTYQDEARLFAYQTGAIPVSAVKIFNGEVISGNMEALNIKSAVELAGYKISTTGSKNGNAITAINALKKAYKKLEYDGLVNLMKTIRMVWGDNPYGIGAKIIGGMTVFFYAYKGDFKISALVDALKKPGCTPQEIIGGAKALGDSRGKNIARIILAKYNYQKKNKLPDKL